MKQFEQEEENEVYFLDGHSLAHRAFYALPMLTNSEGEYTNSVFGFTKMLLRLMDENSPGFLAVAFDREGKTFRHEEYEDYKADRKETPEELKPQFDRIKGLLDVFNIPIFESEGYEADDIIGTLARQAENQGYIVNIVTGDRDALQLVDDNINVLYTKQGITDLVKYNLERVREEYELEPDQLVDMKGLMGDSSDNIPGVPGIGEKTATKLLKEFSDLETILENIDQVSGKKRKENLRKNSEQARMSKRLGLIDTDVPVNFNEKDCRWGGFDEGEVYEFLAELDFNSLLDRFESDRTTLDGQNINIKNLDNGSLNKLKKDIKQQGELRAAALFSDDTNPRRVRGDLLIMGPDTEVYRSSVSLLKELRDVFYDDEIGVKAAAGKKVLLALCEGEKRLPEIDFEPRLARYLLNPSESLPEYNEILREELEVEVDEDISREKLMAFVLENLDVLEENLLSQLQNKNLLKLYRDLEIPLLAPLAHMQYFGIRIDRDYLKELSDRWQERIDEIIEQAHELAGEKFNLNSPQQVGEILFDKLELPVIKKTKTGYSTSMSVLEELEDMHPIVPLIMEYRHWSKLKSTYLEALPPLVNEETGRIHTSFNQMVTATGRLSSTDPNLQNIPIRSEEGREIRRAFLPGNENWKLLCADYSQIELRILAHISGDKALLETFAEGGDIHNETACRIFQVERDEVTGNMRRKAKVINFGIAYGMSAYGLSQDLDISRQEAEKYIDRYFERFEGVEKYMDEIVKEAGEKGYVTTLFNRRRYIPDIKSSNYHRRSFAERTAINTPIQGSAADIMKLAMLDVYKKLKNCAGRMLLQVHDELVLEVPEEDLNDVAFEVKKAMESCYDLDVPLIVDLEAGNNWKEKQEIVVD